MDKGIYEYILNEESAWKTTRIPITESKDWNMYEHIQRCMNVSNGWFHSGKNDGMRPYKDIVTPIIDVAFRAEGFDVKDIVPFVDDKDHYYKSFLVKKYHPQWARKHELDTFIDEVVESSIIYDLVLVKKVGKVRPEVVPLQEIAFCDQTDVLAGSICLKHQYSISELLGFKGKWDSTKIDEAITMAKASKEVSLANKKEAKTPGKYIEVYELHGTFPDSWLNDSASPDSYSSQMHIVCYWLGSDGQKHGLTLFKGKEKESIFRALKIDTVRSFGRACGRSIVERLFEPQVWANYSEIRIKKLLDAASIVLFQSEGNELSNQNLDKLTNNRVIDNKGKPITKLDTTAGANLSAFSNKQEELKSDARMLGNASEASLGKNPVAGTPFSTVEAIIQQGDGIHEYRQGKIATFFADILYRDWILDFLVNEMNGGINFSEELSLEELKEISETIITNQINKKIKDQILNGTIPTPEVVSAWQEKFTAEFMKGGNRRFFQILKDELKNIPTNVMVNISGKQRNMAKNADRLSKLISNILTNPQAFTMIPGLGSAYNQLLEESGMNPIDFSQIIKGVSETPEIKTKQLSSPVGSGDIKNEEKQL